MAGRKLPKSLTEEQITALLEQVEGKSSTALRNRAVLVLMADGGLRLDEALSLETGDLRRQKGEVASLHLTHTKGGWERVVYLTGRGRDTLARWVERREARGLEGKLVFTTLSEGKRRFPQRGKEGFVAGPTQEKQITPGRKVSARYVRDLVKRLAQKAGLPDWVHPHSLRHTAAQRLFNSTGNIELVRKFLGHRAVTTTQIYAEADDPQVQAAVEALDAAPAAEADQVQRLAKTLAALPQEQRQALAEALTATE